MSLRTTLSTAPSFGTSFSWDKFAVFKMVFELTHINPESSALSIGADDFWFNEMVIHFSLTEIFYRQTVYFRQIFCVLFSAFAISYFFEIRDNLVGQRLCFDFLYLMLTIDNDAKVYTYDQRPDVQHSVLCKCGISSLIHLLCIAGQQFRADKFLFSFWTFHYL